VHRLFGWAAVDGVRGWVAFGLFVISCGTQRFHLANAGANGWAGRCLSLDMRK
jgi:hypothetical protein